MSLRKIESVLALLAEGLNQAAGAGVVLMMLIITADVVLRFFRHPIPGAYDLIGILSALVLSFSLAKTTLEKGHIAVDFLVLRLPEKAQHAMDMFNHAVSAVLFAVIAWQLVSYAGDMRGAKQLLMTLRIPLHPFIYGTGFGAGLLSLYLVIESLKSGLRLHLKSS